MNRINPVETADPIFSNIVLDIVESNESYCTNLIQKYLTLNQNPEQEEAIEHALQEKEPYMNVREGFMQGLIGILKAYKARTKQFENQ